MAAGAASPRRWTRRRTLLLAGVPLLLAAPAAGQQREPILVASRKRLLNETRHARALLEAEKRLTAELQARIDATKRELTAEEKELAELRATLPREEFEARTSAFDRKVRRERREAQRHAAALQRAFRDERVKLVAALDRVLEQVRAARGASMIINEEDAMAVDPALDITDTVIARFDATVPPPEIPTLESVLAGIEGEEEDTEDSDGG